MTMNKNATLLNSFFDKSNSSREVADQTALRSISDVDDLVCEVFGKERLYPRRNLQNVSDIMVLQRIVVWSSLEIA